MPEWLLDLFARYGYAVVFVGVLLENAGLPVPGETVLLAGAALAHFGQLSLGWVIVTAIAGAILGDNIGFLIGRRGGRGLAERHGWRIGLTPERLREFDRFFARHGPKTVFIARFVTGLRVVGAVLAGGSGLPWPPFLIFNAAGAVVWARRSRVAGYCWRTVGRRSSAGSAAAAWSRSLVVVRAGAIAVIARAARRATMITLANGLVVHRSALPAACRASSPRRCCTDRAASRSSIPDRRARCRRCARRSSEAGIAIARRHDACC